MELRHLRYFVAVAEELHFGRAAARLHLAQPPLTRQIQQLEIELKVQLFHRTKRRVQLTDAGEVLLTEARTLLAQADRTVTIVQRAARGEMGWLGIGFVGTAAYQVLPTVLRAFRGEYPDVEIVLREMSSSAQVQALHERRIHVGFLRPSVPDKALASETIQREPLLIALPAGHRLAAERELPLTALRDEEFVIYPRAPRPSFADQIVELCVQAGFVPRIAQEAQEIQTAISLVAAGIGVALAPASIERLRWPDVVYRPIAPPQPISELNAGYRPDDRSAVLHAFLRVMHTALPAP